MKSIYRYSTIEDILINRSYRTEDIMEESGYSKNPIYYRLNAKVQKRFGGSLSIVRKLRRVGDLLYFYHIMSCKELSDEINSYDKKAYAVIFGSKIDSSNLHQIAEFIYVRLGFPENCIFGISYESIRLRNLRIHSLAKDIKDQLNLEE